VITCLRARPTLLARRIVTRQAPGLTPKKRRPASDGVDGQIRKPGDQGRSGLTPRMATRDSARQRNRSNNQESSTSLESSGASSGSEAESGSRGGAHARRVGHRAGLRLSARSARGDASPWNSWRSPSRPRIGLASSPLPSCAGRTGAAASRRRAISHSIGPAPCPRGPSSGQGVAPRTRHIADATVTSAVVRRPPERPAVMGRPAGPSERENFFTTMNASARIETKAEVGSVGHFSHDVSERLVTKDEEMTAKTCQASGGSSGIEQPT
jgi:hypothetical protein